LPPRCGGISSSKSPGPSTLSLFQFHFRVHYFKRRHGNLNCYKTAHLVLNHSPNLPNLTPPTRTPPLPWRSRAPTPCGWAAKSAFSLDALQGLMGAGAFLGEDIRSLTYIHLIDVLNQGCGKGSKVFSPRMHLDTELVFLEGEVTLAPNFSGSSQKLWAGHGSTSVLLEAGGSPSPWDGEGFHPRAGSQETLAWFLPRDSLPPHRPHETEDLVVPLFWPPCSLFSNRMLDKGLRSGLPRKVPKGIPRPTHGWFFSPQFTMDEYGEAALAIGTPAGVPPPPSPLIRPLSPRAPSGPGIPLHAHLVAQGKDRDPGRGRVGGCTGGV